VSRRRAPDDELEDAVRTLAHDVRGLVAGIRAMARGLRETERLWTSAEGPQYVAEIERASADALEMIDRLVEAPLPNGGGAILRVTMTDKSDPKGGVSAPDTIGITVWYSQAAGSSSPPAGARSTTVEQALGGQGGGELSVR
jgi:hypothetical protein